MNDPIDNLLPESDHDDLRELIKELERASGGLDELIREIQSKFEASGGWESLLRELEEAAGEIEDEV